MSDKKSKIIVIFIIILLSSLAYLAYNYGYLINSAKNFPKNQEVSETGPVSLSRPSNPELSFVNLPEGFAIDFYAKDVPGARSMTLSDSGVVYVGTRTQGVVYALEDTDNDSFADTRYVIASGLNSPNGVAYKDGDLYVAEISRIIKFQDIDNNYKNNPTFEVVFDDYPTDTHHGWKYIAFGPDGNLYVPVGAPCNVCEEPDPYASLTRLSEDFKEYEVIARGIRNTVGFDWNPSTGNLWFTDNGRDWFGDDMPPDELNVITENGQHFGYPYCHGGNLIDDEFGEGKSCEDYVSPIQNLGPHVAALGMDFYEGSMFPDKYNNKAFIAEHGSWNRKVPIGYRITMVEVSGDEASNYEVFADGWLNEEGIAYGRPVDIIELSDGSILISDDKAGSIYRIYYNN